MSNVTKSCIGKDPLKCQDRLKDFKVTECEMFINIISGFISLLIFKEMPRVVFWNNIKEYPKSSEKKLTKYSPPSPNYYLWRLHFHHVLQIKQNIATEWMWK